MAITKPPKPANSASPAADAFIAGAPDAAAASARNGVRKGNKLQITFTIAPTLLDRLDQRAGELGQSRAALINLAIAKALEAGF